MEHKGASIMLLIRLSPFIPFNLFNYATGISNCNLCQYLIGLIGTIPGNFLYAYIGTACKSLHEAYRGEYDHGVHYGIYIGGLVLTTITYCWVIVIANGKVVQELETRRDTDEVNYE